MRTFKNMYLILAAFLFALMLRNPVMAAGPDPVEQVKPVIGKITAMLTTDAYKKQSREKQFRSFLDRKSSKSKRSLARARKLLNCSSRLCFL